VDLALTGVADDGARWFEYSSDAFAELGLNPDGFYAISSLPSIGGAFGSGVDVFPRDNAFDLGSLSYDDAGLTGVGVEAAPITGYSVEFDLNIADDDALANNANDNRGYGTTISNLQGTVEFTDSVLTSIDLTAAITFTYRVGTSLFIPYDGTFSVQGDRFDLLVDDTEFAAGQNRRYVWEATGVVDQVVQAPVPGDYNGDGVADADDYALWVSQFGGAGPDSDGNGNGVVDAADYTIWRDRFSASAAASAAPEPATAAFATLAACFFSARRRAW
ncbi:MAG: hypothetical protein AAF743_10550, partial [Planctomycetota bacterium]